MDTGWPISCISSRQVNDRLFNHPVHLSSNKSFIGMIRCPSSGSMVQLLRKPGRRESIPTPHPAPLRKAGLLVRCTALLLAATGGWGASGATGYLFREADRSCFGKQFWINLLLTILGYIPGVVHAVWVIAKY
jgi:hypothetical protein